MLDTSSKGPGISRTHLCEEIFCEKIVILRETHQLKHSFCDAPELLVLDFEGGGANN